MKGEPVVAAVNWPLGALCGLTLLSSTLALAGVPGTSDMRAWESLAVDATERGPAQAFIPWVRYLPGPWYVLWISAKITGSTGLPGIKASIVCFWIAYVAVIAALGIKAGRDSALVALVALNPAIGLHAVLLGYIDIYYAALVAGGLWLMSATSGETLTHPARRLYLSGFLLGLGVWMKPQPILLFPFCLVHLATHKPTGSRVHSIGWAMAGGATVLAAGCALHAGLGGSVLDLARAIREAFRESIVSGNALNLNWIVTYALHLFDPTMYQSLGPSGENTFIRVSVRWLKVLNLLMVGGAYLAILLWQRRGTSAGGRFLAACALGAMAYFAVGYGIHENHLIIAMLPTTLWVLSAPSAFSKALLGILSLIQSVNLVVFYGIDGVHYPPRVVGGLDLSVPLAGCNVLVCWLLLASALFRPESEEATG
jgi:hypothetical protein